MRVVRRGKQQYKLSVTETWMNEYGQEDAGYQEVKIESEMVSSM